MFPDYFFAVGSTHDGALDVEGELPRLGHRRVSLQNYTLVSPLGYRNGPASGPTCLKKISMIADHPLDHSSLLSAVLKFFFAGFRTLGFGLLGLVGEPQPKFESPTGDPPTQGGGHPRMNPPHVQMIDFRRRAPSIFIPPESACPSGRARPKGLRFHRHPFTPFFKTYPFFLIVRQLSKWVPKSKFQI